MLRFHEIRWTVEDWKDFYRTLAEFKARVLARHIAKSSTTTKPR